MSGRQMGHTLAPLNHSTYEFSELISGIVLRSLFNNDITMALACPLRRFSRNLRFVRKGVIHYEKTFVCRRFAIRFHRFQLATRSCQRGKSTGKTLANRLQTPAPSPAQTSQLE